MNLSSTPLALLALLLACPLPALAQELCDPIPPDDRGEKCAAAEYGVYGSKNERCEGSKSCLPWNQAPQPASLECVPVLRGYDCHAWPVAAAGEEALTYRWVGEGNVNAGSTAATTSNRRYIACGSGAPTTMGWVTVTITSPFGVSSSVSAALDCKAAQVR